MNSLFLTRQLFGEKWPKIWLKIWLKVKENGTQKIKLAKMVAEEIKIS